MWQQLKWGVFRERAADGHHAAQFEVLLPWPVRYKVWVPRLNFAQALGIVHCGQGLDFDVRAPFLGVDQGPGGYGSLSGAPRYFVAGMEPTE